jgi:hypothetical protein
MYFVISSRYRQLRRSFCNLLRSWIIECSSFGIAASNSIINVKERCISLLRGWEGFLHIWSSALTIVMAWIAVGRFLLFLKYRLFQLQPDTVEYVLTWSNIADQVRLCMTRQWVCPHMAKKFSLCRTTVAWWYSKFPINRKRVMRTCNNRHYSQKNNMLFRILIEAVILILQRI